MGLIDNFFNKLKEERLKPNGVVYEEGTEIYTENGAVKLKEYTDSYVLDTDGRRHYKVLGLASDYFTKGQKEVISKPTKKKNKVLNFVIYLFLFVLITAPLSYFYSLPSFLLPFYYVLASILIWVDREYLK